MIWFSAETNVHFEYEISLTRTKINLRNKNVIHSITRSHYLLFIYYPEKSTRLNHTMNSNRQRRTTKISRHYTHTQTQTTNLCTVVPIPKWQQERERGKKNNMSTSYQSAGRTLSLIMRMMNCVCGRFDMVRCSGGRKNGMCRIAWSVCDAFKIQRQQSTNVFIRQLCYIIFLVFVKKDSYFLLWVCTLDLIISECVVDKGNKKKICIYMVRQVKIELCAEIWGRANENHQFSFSFHLVRR